MVNTVTKVTWVGEGLSALYFHSIEKSLEEGQDRDSSRAGTRREQLIQRPWRGALTDLLPISLIPYRVRTTILGQPHPQWAEPSRINY